MIHHIFIIDGRDDIIMHKKFWIINVNQQEVQGFAQRVKDAKSLLIELDGSNKYIGQPLGRGVIVLCAENVDEDATLIEKVYKVTDEFRRVIQYEVEYEDFMKKIDDYVITTLKVSILGYGGVGKTTMVTLLNGGDPPRSYIPTIGIDIQKLEGARIGTYELITWDFAGQDRFRKLWKVFFQRSRLIFLVTDSTLENVLQSKEIIDFIKQQGIEGDVVAIANKQDLQGALEPNLVHKILGVKTYGLTAIDPNDREKGLLIIRESLERSIQIPTQPITMIDFVP